MPARTPIRLVIFLPTPSARRATYLLLPCVSRTLISTHALREEGDENIVKDGPVVSVFLPTPSARRATSGITFGKGGYLISTHALREEGDYRRADHDDFWL